MSTNTLITLNIISASLNTASFVSYGHAIAAGIAVANSLMALWLMSGEDA